MPQETIVLELAPDEQRALLARLEGVPFEHRTVPHARLSVKGEGVVATLYASGKLVVQGEDPAGFALRYLEGAGRPAGRARGSSAAAEALVPPGRAVVGSDEAGKGDFLGPLVVCALRLPPEHREGVRRAGVTDSKTLSDVAVRRMAPVLEKSFPCAVEVLDPPEYNRLHAEVGNLNRMLADLHARAVRRVAEEGDVVLVDRFAEEGVVASRLVDLPVELVQAVRAEREPAVAAASVIARARFLERLAELSEELAVDLHKGAGPPADRSAAELVRLHGIGALGRAAKLHFQNARRVPRG